MVFDHKVKHNGILYEVGMDVPIEDKKAENKPVEAVKTEAKEEVKAEAKTTPKKPTSKATKTAPKTTKKTTKK